MNTVTQTAPDLSEELYVNSLATAQNTENDDEE